MAVDFDRLPENRPDDQAVVGDFEGEMKLKGYDFILPGLGNAGEDCGINRVSEIGIEKDSDNPKVAVRYEPLNCKRLECPDCFNREVIERIFKMAVIIEAYAKINGVRPVLALGSIPPKQVTDWDRTRLNNSLFRRFRRRGGRYSNVGGGIHFFHPFRIKKQFKEMLREKGYGSGDLDAGYWRGVREDVLDVGDWRRYVKFGCHIHNFVFPEDGESYDEHKSEDFLIRFKDEGGKPKRLDINEVIAHLKYFMSHLGVMNHKGDMKNYFKSVRKFGCLYKFDPEDELSEDELVSIKKKVARNIWIGVDDGEDRCMDYDPDEDMLVFPYGEDGDRDKYEWFGVWELKDFLNNADLEDLRDRLSEAQIQVIDEIWSYCWVLGVPPPFDARGIEYSDPGEIEGVRILGSDEIVDLVTDRDSEALDDRE